MKHCWGTLVYQLPVALSTAGQTQTFTISWPGSADVTPTINPLQNVQVGWSLLVVAFFFFFPVVVVLSDRKQKSPLILFRSATEICELTACVIDNRHGALKRRIRFFD